MNDGRGGRWWGGLGRQATRFVAAGVFNTVFSYLVYLALLLVMPYAFAYSVAYAVGIVTSFLLQSLFVFRTPIVWRKLLGYPAVYVAQYLIGLATLWVCVERLGIDERIAPWIALAVAVPPTFLLTRGYLLRRPRRGPRQ